MAHWFNEGKDWIADSTGNTMLANNYLIDGLDGLDDVTADGTQANPYKTLTYAVSQHGGGVGIIYITAPTVVYADFNLAMNSAQLKGDGMVEFKGTGSEKINLDGDSNTLFTNLIFNLCTPYFNRNDVGVVQCVLIGLALNNSGGSVLTEYNECIFINSTIEDLSTLTTSGTELTSCKMINSTIKTFVGRNGFLKSKGCYFDSTSIFQVEDTTSTNSEIVDSNFRGSKVSTGALAFSDIVTESNVIDLDPLYRNAGGGDYTIPQSSPHVLSGYLGANIADDLVSEYSEYQGQTALDAAVAANANISYSGIGELVNSSGVSQNVDLSEVVFADIKYIGKISFSGNNNVHKIKLFIDWAGLDDIYGGYREFKFDEVLSLDDSNRSNGEDLYSWAQINKITAKKYKVRLQVAV